MSDIPVEAGKPDDVRRALALLNAAGARIGNSLDLETTARELLDVAVPQFCDLASVDLFPEVLSGEDPRAGEGLDGTRALRRVAFASAVSDGPVTLGGQVGAGDPDPVELGSLHRYAAGSPYADALRTAGVRTAVGTLVQSTLAVPMVARGRVLGLVQFSRTKGSEPFADRDAALAAELAARAAVCVDNARLYRREHHRALILQRSLLPPDDPEAAGLDIACRYLPGSAATEVGGDWFDVIELPGHRTALVVGDVMGRGLRAAVAMGELRTAVRTLALLDLEPAEVLSALDEIARGLGASGHGGERAGRGEHGGKAADLSEVYLATCVYAVYDPVTRRCVFANAGHLPPVLVEPPDGDERPALLLEIPKGVPLGVGGEPFEETEVELPDGSLLALYTDGLVESRHQPLDEGLDALRTTLTGPDRPLEDVCDEVLGALDTHHGEDDVALLLARVQGLPAEAVGDWLLPAEPRSVARARELAREQLAVWNLDDLGDTAELLVSEVVTNALRHGAGALPRAPHGRSPGQDPEDTGGLEGLEGSGVPGGAGGPGESRGSRPSGGGDIRLRLLLDRTVVCEVWDANLVQPRRRRARDTDEGGRGLQLVDLLSTGWGSRRTPRGKTVWFELALPDGEPKPPDTAEALLSLF